MPRLDNVPAPIIPPMIFNLCIEGTVLPNGTTVHQRDWSVWLTSGALVDFALAESAHTRDADDMNAAAEYLLRPRGGR